MIPRKYTSLNSPIMALNVITSCLSTVPSDCSSIFSVIDNDWKVKGELITETEISQLSTISKKEFYKNEIELEYQDCSDDPSILFCNNNIKSHTSTIIDTKKIKSALPLYILYTYPITRARVYKSFEKIINHEIRYAKEQALWSQPNNHGIHSVVLMVSSTNGVEQKNFQPPIIETSDSILNVSCTNKSCKIIVEEELINSAKLENDIECFTNEEITSIIGTIEYTEISDTSTKYIEKPKIKKKKINIEKNDDFVEEKFISKNFKGIMNIRDRIADYKNSDITDYTKKVIKKRCNIAPHPLNAFFSKENIQFKEYVNYDELTEKINQKPHIDIKKRIYATKDEHETSTIVNTINENEALEEGDINYSMITTELSDIESSTNCNTTIQQIDCEKLTRKLNNINIDNEYTDDSSKLISLPNTFSFLSKDYTTSCEVQRTVKRNYTDTCTFTKFENDDEVIIYEDMLQQLNSIKNVLNDFDMS
ncbi:Hypothetical protein SRAE_2000308800 [Strongyloides ratti]|uniref:Uncharacterized protein n=1 Tax=Strongyloides ratti TaxID=34506 RepID=A0A090LF58_STRRB|nr:Hypothetical protein SRAE_2000308800 [Strongyloides ratti]CEF68431.1 Hypothetical protein SRAE_2000308800 [Strongyloides ratti]